MVGPGQKYSWTGTGIVCPEALVTQCLALGKEQLPVKGKQSHVKSYMELEEFSVSKLVARLSLHVLVSITLHVTKCPWLDLVGICKPQDSRRDVWEEGIMCCGANFICNSLTQE